MLISATYTGHVLKFVKQQYYISSPYYTLESPLIYGRINFLAHKKNAMLFLLFINQQYKLGFSLKFSCLRSQEINLDLSKYEALCKYLKYFSTHKTQRIVKVAVIPVKRSQKSTEYKILYREKS